MRYPGEPHELIAGVLIHIGARSMVDGLRATGHIVEVDQYGNLVVAPMDDLHENELVCLEAFEEDILLLLAVGERTIH